VGLLQFLPALMLVLGAISLDLLAVLPGGAVFGLATLVFGLSTSFALSLLALGITGAADMVSVVVRQTMIQLETPDAMRWFSTSARSIHRPQVAPCGRFPKMPPWTFGSSATSSRSPPSSTTARPRACCM